MSSPHICECRSLAFLPPTTPVVFTFIYGWPRLDSNSSSMLPRMNSITCHGSSLRPTLPPALHGKFELAISRSSPYRDGKCPFVYALLPTPRSYPRLWLQRRSVNGHRPACEMRMHCSASGTHTTSLKIPGTALTVSSPFTWCPEQTGHLSPGCATSPPLRPIPANPGSLPLLQSPRRSAFESRDCQLAPYYLHGPAKLS
jgi:hypothetical protein